MSATETETVGLNLDGNFAANAAKAAAAAEKCDAALKKMGSSKTGIDSADASMKKLAADANVADKAMEKIGKSHAKSIGGGGFASLFGDSRGLALSGNMLGKIFGDGARNSFEKGLGVLASGLDATGLTPGMMSGAAGLLGSAGGLVMKGGEIVLAAAAALSAAALGLGVAGAKLGIEKTAQKESGAASMGKGNFEMAMKLAAKYNIDEGEAITQVKKMLNAGFAKKEIPVLMRVKAGMDATGLDGDALIQKLATMKLGTKIGTKDIEGLRKMGVDVNAVYKKMAEQTGMSVDAVKAKVKAGKMDADAARKAIEAATSDQFGKVADKMSNGIGAIFNRLKMAFGALFDDMDLGPIKDFLKMLTTALQGDAGAKLKASLKSLFASVSGIFKNIKIGDVTRFITAAAAAIQRLAGIISQNGPKIARLGEAAMWAALVCMEAFNNIVAGAFTIEAAIESAVSSAEAKWESFKKAFDSLTLESAIAAVMSFVASLLGIDLGSIGQQLGAALTAGLSSGILAGAAQAIAAAGSMVQSVIDAARAAADAHSPSRVMASLGNVGLGGGLAQGMDAANDNVGKAGAKLAGAGMGGAAAGMGAVPAAGAGGGKAGGAGGGSITINVTAGPNASAQDVAKEVVIKLRELQAEAA